MSYTIQWAEGRNNVLLVELSDRWTWDDLYLMTRDQLAMMDTVNHPVHTIFFTKGRSMHIPPNVFSNTKRLIQMTHPNEDIKVFVSPPAMARVVLNTVSKIYGLRTLVDKYWFTSSIEEALTKLDAYERARIDD